MGDVKDRSTLQRWVEQGGASGSPNPAPPTLPSRREGGGGAPGKSDQGGVEQNPIPAADVKAGIERELRALAGLGRSGSDALRDAVAIVAGKIRNAPALVERQAHDGRCHACSEPLDETRPVVAVMQAKGGGCLWVHGGECHAEHSRRRAALVNGIMAAAGYGVEQQEGKTA